MILSDIVQCSEMSGEAPWVRSDDDGPLLLEVMLRAQGGRSIVWRPRDLIKCSDIEEVLVRVLGIVSDRARTTRLGLLLSSMTNKPSILPSGDVVIVEKLSRTSQGTRYKLRALHLSQSPF